MPIKYHIYEDLGLLCTLFYGMVDKDDTFEYLTLINSDSNVSQVQRSIVLLKESELIFNIEDVESFSRKLVLSKSLKKRDKIALLIENPTDTVVATIFSQIVRTLRKEISVGLFYTMDAAIQFLDLTEKRAEVDGILSQRLHQNSIDTDT
jgi:hypothetical protein